jgi:hypothetical protein
VIGSPIFSAIAIAQLGFGSVETAEAKLSSYSGSSDHGGNAVPSQGSGFASSSILGRE